MSELTLTWVTFLKIILLAFVGLLYRLGGMSGKWKRRFVASAILVGGICLFSVWQESFNWVYLAMYPFLVASYTMGYGVNSKLTKLLKSKYLVRLAQGILLACASLPIAIVNDAWVLFGLHTTVLCVSSIVLGVINPVEPAEEESLFGVLSGMFPLFMI